MRRVAITGMGTVNALGTGVGRYAAGLRAGTCAIRPLTLFDTGGFRSAQAAQVDDVTLPASVPRAVVRRASRSARLALIATDEAWRAAGLLDADRAAAGIVIGTTTGGMASGEESHRQTVAGERPRHFASRWLETPLAAPGDIIAAVYGCAGPRITVSTACSSGANAIGIAADWIRSGLAEVVLCGGTDSLCRMTYSGFNALQALDRVPCRPFDRARAGLSLGEGAAMLVLEDWQHARARDAEILSEVVSYGISADAHHLTQPRPDGAGQAAALRQALTAGGVAAEEIDYVNAHGTGTPLNDVVETRVIKDVLGNHAYRIPVTSTKSMIGHCLGAAGALEALASVLAIREGFIPPTATLTEPDEECDLDYVPGVSRPATLRTVLSNSYGFGGNNTSLIVRAADA